MSDARSETEFYTCSAHALFLSSITTFAFLISGASSGFVGPVPLAYFHLAISKVWQWFSSVSVYEPVISNLQPVYSFPLIFLFGIASISIGYFLVCNPEDL